MITKREANKRIKRWNGEYRQEVCKRPDGVEFVITTLYYKDHNSPLAMPGTFQERTVDIFIHPK